MSIVSDLPDQRSTHRRTKRQRVAAAVLGMVAFTGVGVAAAAPASAAGPSSLPSYGWSADFPTWSFGGITTLCVRNDGWSRWGYARVASRTGVAAEYMSIAPRATTCIRRSWWGVPITVTNVSYTPLVAWTY